MKRTLPTFGLSNSTRDHRLDRQRTPFLSMHVQAGALDFEWRTWVGEVIAGAPWSYLIVSTQGPVVAETGPQLGGADGWLVGPPGISTLAHTRPTLVVGEAFSSDYVAHVTVRIGTGMPPRGNPENVAYLADFRMAPLQALVRTLSREGRTH